MRTEESGVRIGEQTVAGNLGKGRGNFVFTDERSAHVPRLRTPIICIGLEIFGWGGTKEKNAWWKISNLNVSLKKRERLSKLRTN